MTTELSHEGAPLGAMRSPTGRGHDGKEPPPLNLASRSSAPTDADRRLYDQVMVSVVACRKIGLAKYEEPSGDLDELVTRVRALLDEAVNTLGAVIARYDDTEDAHHEVAANAGGFMKEVDRRMQSMREAKDIADLAFMARMGLRGREQALNALTGNPDRWDVIAVASGAVRGVRKSLSALAQSISAFAGIKVEDDFFATEITVSVQSRDAYRRFCRDVAVAQPTTDEEVMRALRRAGTGIAKLTSREAYPDLRVDDRIQIRGFQARILQWLRTHANGNSHARNGLRIWQDFSSFADLLMQINNRAELIEHDAAVLNEVRDRIASLGVAGADFVTNTLVEKAKAVQGRDPGLDALLKSGQGQPQVWLDTIDQILTALESSQAARSEPTGGFDLEIPEGDFF